MAVSSDGQDVRMSRAVLLAAVAILGGAQSRADAGDDASRGRLKHWLAEASAKGDVAPSSTAIPFEYRTTNVKKQCEGTFKDSKALAGWWTCFKKAEDYLLTDVRNGGDVGSPSPAEPLPKPLAKLAKRIKTPGTWAEGVLVGDGMSSHFLFLTTDSGQIAALLVDVDFF
jgi:hypothetical protein